MWDSVPELRRCNEYTHGAWYCAHEHGAVPDVSHRGFELRYGIVCGVFVFVAAQLLLVRYPDVKILLQIPVSLLFSVFIDVLDIWLFPFTATGLIDGLVMLVIAVSFTALGVTLIVSARLVPVAPDDMVQTLSQVFHCEFGKAKYFFDGGCVCIALVYGLVRTGSVVGIGIGTVAAALLAGSICTFWGRLLNRRLMAFMEEPANM